MLSSKKKKAKINANVLRKSIKDFFPQKTKQKIEKNNIFVLRRNRHKKTNKNIYIQYKILQKNISEISDDLLQNSYKKSQFKIWDIFFI